MSHSTIPLSKPYTPAKLDFPVFLSVKHDGVPVRIDVVADGLKSVNIGVQTRSGEDCKSTALIVQTFIQRLMEKGVTFITPMTFVAEVTSLDHTDFKDISGTVRRQTAQENLVLNFFDFHRHTPHDTDMPFYYRTKVLQNLLDGCECKQVKYVEQLRIGEQAVLERWMELNTTTEQEGWIVRSHNAAFKPDTRHWDYQKHVADPTCDLKILGFEEAVSADGKPLNMVGRVLADYHGETIGIGPGKLSHTERTNLWREFTTLFRPNACASEHFGIATIKYKRDDSYTALRQPTFQHWRTDKTEASYA